MPSLTAICDELVDAGRELLVTRALQSLAEHRHDLAPRPSVHEDDEAKAELRLVGAFSSASSASTAGSSSVPCSAAERDDVALPPIGRVRVEHLLLLVFRQLARDVARAAERVVELGELLDEGVRPSNSSASSLGAQLPR